MRILAFAALMALGLPGMAQNTDVNQLNDLVRRFGEAWLATDTSTLNLLLASQYTHTDISGKVLNREDWLADAANTQSWLRAPTGTAKPTIEFQDMNIDLFGDSAVITGRNLIHSASPESKPIDLRFTQVWIKEKGKWKRRFFQATLVAEAKK